MTDMQGDVKANLIPVALAKFYNTIKSQISISNTRRKRLRCT